MVSVISSQIYPINCGKTYFILLSIFVMFNFTSATTFLHQVQSNNSAASIIHAHFLRVDDLTSAEPHTATLLEIEHHRPLLFWDELSYEGFHLTRMEKDTFLVSGDRIDLSDFSRDVVLHIPGAYLKSENPAKKHNYFLIENFKVLKAIDNSQPPQKVLLGVSRVEASHAIRKVDFRFYKAHIHPRIIKSGQKLRRFHVYGRHGPAIRTIKSSDLDASVSEVTQNTFMRQDGPMPGSDICVGLTNANIFSILGQLQFKGGVDCDIAFTGQILQFENDVSSQLRPNQPVVSKTKDLNQSTSMNSSGLTVNQVLNKPENVPVARFNVSLSAIGYGTAFFGIIGDKFGQRDLNVTLEISGRISSRFSCPFLHGCTLRGTINETIVTDFRRFLTAPQNFRLEALTEEYEVRTEIKLRTYSVMRSLYSYSLNFEQQHEIKMELQTRSKDPKSNFYVVSSKISTPTANVTIDKEQKGKGPRGVVVAHIKFDGEIEDQDTTTSMITNYTVGQFFITSDRANYPFNPIPWGANNGTCDTCHQRRTLLSPFLRNVNSNYESTRSIFSVNKDQQRIMKTSVAPRLTICQVPITCQN